MFSATTSNRPTAIIELLDGGDIMGWSAGSAQRDVMRRSRFDRNACEFSTEKFCALSEEWGRTMPMARKVPAFKSVMLRVKNSVCVYGMVVMNCR